MAVDTLVKTRRALRVLDPVYAADEARRVYAKLRRRLQQVDTRVVTLPAKGKHRGRILYSYIVDPFLLPPGATMPHSHTHYWESWRMATNFAEAGFEVTCLHWTNAEFTPSGEYAYAVDVRLNLERWAPRLNPGCVKIMHAETAHWWTHNQAQHERLEALARRRLIRLAPFRLVEENRCAETADRLTILGNEFTMSSYLAARKPIDRLPISSPCTYSFPAKKDFDACRKRFLWFGSGGFLHKGLDLVLEAFARMPDLELIVCGPLAREKEFELAFWTELYDTPNIRTVGWVDIDSRDFLDLADTCIATVYASCSEGGGGSTITCMHAGLIPMVSRAASIDVRDSTGVVLGQVSVDGVIAAVRQLAARKPHELEDMAHAAWAFVRERHTRERFAEEHKSVVSRLVGLGR